MAGKTGSGIKQSGAAAAAETHSAAQPQRQSAAQRQSAFFGRRKGRPLRQKQDALFAALLPRLQLDLSRPAPADLTQLFSAPVKEARLEIGFGGGEHLLHEASRCAESGFIGIEPFVNGMAKMLAALEAEPRRAANIRLYADDALPVLNWLPPAGLAGIDIFYPDPWPKKKHHKRRFVSAENLRRFARALKPGGALRFASDIESYTEQVLQLMRDEPAFSEREESARNRKTPYAGWPGTRYEAKAKREGRSPVYLSFIRR